VRRFLGALAIAVLAAGCSGAAATPTIVYVTPTPAATAVPPAAPADPNLGKVAFGTHFNATTLLIDKGSATFSRTASQVCWSADLSASPTHATVRQLIVRIGSGGVETAVRSQNDEVSNADMNLWANCEPFQAEVGNVKGTYVLRFLDGVKVLAEGRFVLK
jgi:polyisoprenoid-binding protein YceI